MYREFNVVGVSAQLSKKVIDVEFTLAIDPASVNLDTLILTEEVTNNIVDYVLSVKKNVARLTLRDWPKTNINYILTVQPGIQSIVEDPLVKASKRKIMFKSEVTSTIQITSPSNHEEINEITVSLRELNDNETETNEYKIEISDDTAFHNVVKSSKLFDKTSITLNGLEEGQYFVRSRAERGDEYGAWSESIAFLYKRKAVKKPVVEIDNGMSIIDQPESGITPSSFIIEFDSNIDPETIAGISLARRKI